ncbi:MAG TPA: hypothetical protein VK966_02125 [Longimicrobiales bacterium]|nr:hypothetical protein [Longimicrobiales bacterium]
MTVTTATEGVEVDITTTSLPFAREQAAAWMAVVQHLEEHAPARLKVG